MNRRRRFKAKARRAFRLPGEKTAAANQRYHVDTVGRQQLLALSGNGYTRDTSNVPVTQRLRMAAQKYRITVLVPGRTITGRTPTPVPLQNVPPTDFSTGRVVVNKFLAKESKTKKKL